jgi:predicted SAM-dependent methyltransferase
MRNILKVWLTKNKEHIKRIIKKRFPKSILRSTLRWYAIIQGWYYSRNYHGNAVICPCCGKTFSTFMDFNKYVKLVNESRYRNNKNKVCPNCYSLPRHRIVVYYFNENKSKLPTDKILMFAAEYSIKKWFDSNGYQYTNADLFDRSADVKVDIQKMPFSDESWSLILCNHILEHVPDYKIALKELNRILSKDGILEITIPTDRNFDTVYEDKNVIDTAERIEKFGQYDHLRIFGNNFKELLIDAGFSVEVVDGDTLPNEIGGAIGPANYDDNRVYICRKNNKKL